MSKSLYDFHEGYDLYNLGFTAGILGSVIIAVLKLYHFEITPQFLLSTEYDIPLKILCSSAFFSLIIIGGFRTLEVVVIATSLSFFVGSFLGMIAGYFEGNIGTIIKSTVDLMMVVPTLIIALIITSIFGITPVTAGISLGIFGIGNYMNQSEALTKAEKNKDYILASKLLGVPWYVVLFRRIFVNILARLLVNLGNTASGVILQYSALTFIGLGSDYTKPDWGAMLYQYRIYLVRKPSLIIIPTLCILWVSLSFNLIFDKREN